MAEEAIEDPGCFATFVRGNLNNHAFFFITESYPSVVEEGLNRWEGYLISQVTMKQEGKSSSLAFKTKL